MTTIPNMLQENVDYELIPNKKDHWDIRILRGIFVETVINFGVVRMNEKTGIMNFDFNLVYSPDEDLKSDNIDLQKHCGKILESVLIGATQNEN